MNKLFIVNSRAESKALARFKAAYFDYSAGKESETRVVYTEFAGHAAEVASKASEEDDLLVIACGGDGTIHEVANALAESSTPLAVIPLGTGNDFTRSVMDENHRSNFYVPNNVAICMAGDFEPDKVVDIIERYFGQWKPGADVRQPEFPAQRLLTAPSDTTIIGQQADQVWMKHPHRQRGASSLLCTLRCRPLKSRKTQP